MAFNNLEDLLKAVEACDNYCRLQGYQIIELDNRLSQSLTVLLKIRIADSVGEFQLLI